MKGSTSHALCCIAAAVVFLALMPRSGVAEEVVVGVIHWEKYAYAEMMKRSYEMALEAVNAEAAPDAVIRLAFADDRGERRAGEKAVADLVKRKQAAILIGGYSSSNTLYTARAANRLGVPFIVSTAADDRITQRKLKNVYRINPPAAEYTTGLEAFFKEQVTPRSMAIVYENSPYGTGAAMKMMWFCRENEIDLKAIIPYIRQRAGEDYFDRILAPLKTAPPDVVYMVSYLEDGVKLVSHIRNWKLPSLLCGGAGGFTHHRFVEMAGVHAERVVTAALWTPKTGFPGAMDYYNRYLEAFGTPPDYHGVEAYTALLVAAEALKRAPDRAPESLRAALDRIDMATPFGRVRFEHYGLFERQNRIDTLVCQIIDRQLACIWPLSLSHHTFTPPDYWRAP